MSRVNIATGFGQSPQLVASTRLLASEHSCAQRVQLSLEGLCGVSSFLSLTGVGLGLVTGLLAGAMMDRSSAPASMERLGATASGLAIYDSIGVGLA